MATRIDDLEEFAKPVAAELVARSGNLKRILSAGVMALQDSSAETREYYMARAVGKEVERNPEQEKIRAILLRLLDELQIGRSEDKAAMRTEPINELTAKIKHFITYKIPSAEEKRELESLRKALGPPGGETHRRKQKTAS